MISELFVCPKCGAELEDFYLPDDENNWVGAWDDDRFRCCGHLIKPIRFPQVSQDNPMNRTKSCGYFGLADLGMEYKE